MWLLASHDTEKLVAQLYTLYYISVNDFYYTINYVSAVSVGVAIRE